MKRALLPLSILVALVVAGAVIWFAFVKEDAPAALDVSQRPANTSQLTTGTDGTWSITSDSKVRYRAVESFAGGALNQDAVGETSKVTGSAVVAGSTVTAEDAFSVDMASMTSDNARRDNQYNGRIMETAKFPTATFELDGPITLPRIPTDGESLKVAAPGKLTVKAVTKEVTFDLDVKLNGSELLVGSTLPVTWSDFGISSPSLAGFVTVEDSGSIELLLVLNKT